MCLPLFIRQIKREVITVYSNDEMSQLHFGITPNSVIDFQEDVLLID